MATEKEIKEDKHDSMMTWLIRGVITLLGLGVWYIAEKSIDTEKAFNKYTSRMDQKILGIESNFEIKLSNEIGRSSMKDDYQQQDIDENKAKLVPIAEMVIRMDEAKKYLYKEAE